MIRTIPQVDHTFGGYFTPNGRTAEQDHAGVQAWQPAALDTLSG